jgi:type VI secretion system ImpM family protein
LFNKTNTEFSAGYFGKLPEFNDFIKFNAGSNEVLFIDNWLQEGLAYTRLKYNTEWKTKYENLSPTSFFLPVPSSEKIVTGMLYASKDKSNRDFPFLIFSLIPVKHFENFYLIPAELEQTIKTLDNHLRNEEDLSSLNNRIKTFSGNLTYNVPIKNNFRHFLSNTKITEFLTRTKLNNSLNRINSLTYSDNTFIKLLFASDDSNFFNDAGFLIYLLIKKINLTTRHSSIFWNKSNDGEYRVIIFPFKLLPVNFADLISIDCLDNRNLELKSSSENDSAENDYSLEEFYKNF